MIEPSFIILTTSFSLAIFHTVLGVDHYLPFILLGRSERWSLSKTIGWTAICGAGHVASSLTICAAGATLGWHMAKIELFEGMRGHFSSWALMIFGLIYMVYGLCKGLKSKPHSHYHRHHDGTHHKHAHNHDKTDSHSQAHAHKHSRTFWALFVIFILGPCEPLIPLIMIPASEQNTLLMLLVALVFFVATVGTMVACVVVGYFSAKVFIFKSMDKYVHFLSGFALTVSGFLLIFPTL